MNDQQPIAAPEPSGIYRRSSSGERYIPGRAFTVTLEIRRDGVPFGTTIDVIDADTPTEAERIAIEAWTQKRPDLTFHPLLTTMTSDEERHQ